MNDSFLQPITKFENHLWNNDFIAISIIFLIDCLWNFKDILNFYIWLMLWAELGPP